MALRSSTSSPWSDGEFWNGAAANTVGDQFNPVQAKVATIEDNADVTDQTNVYAALPAQTGNAGKVMTTNGSVLSWTAGLALPSQTGNAGKALFTDGAALSCWTAPRAACVPRPRGSHNSSFPRRDESTATRVAHDGFATWKVVARDCHADSGSSATSVTGLPGKL